MADDTSAARVIGYATARSSVEPFPRAARSASECWREIICPPAGSCCQEQRRRAPSRRLRCRCPRPLGWIYWHNGTRLSPVIGMRRVEVADEAGSAAEASTRPRRAVSCTPTKIRCWKIRTITGDAVEPDRRRVKFIRGSRDMIAAAWPVRPRIIALARRSRIAQRRSSSAFITTSVRRRMRVFPASRRVIDDACFIHLSVGASADASSTELDRSPSGRFSQDRRYHTCFMPPKPTCGAAARSSARPADASSRYFSQPVGDFRRRAVVTPADSAKFLLPPGDC